LHIAYLVGPEVAVGAVPAPDMAYGNAADWVVETCILIRDGAVHRVHRTCRDEGGRGRRRDRVENSPRGDDHSSHHRKRDPPTGVRTPMMKDL
jgi:hypothetical protein